MQSSNQHNRLSDPSLSARNFPNNAESDINENQPSNSASARHSALLSPQASLNYHRLNSKLFISASTPASPPQQNAPGLPSIPSNQTVQDYFNITSTTIHHSGLSSATIRSFHSRTPSGLDEEIGRSLIPKLNSPYVAMHQSGPSNRWSGSLRIPDWVSGPASARGSPTSRRTRGMIDRALESGESDRGLFRSRTINSYTSSADGLVDDGGYDSEAPLLSNERTPPRRTKKRNDVFDSDDRFQIEMMQQSGNGLRVWYESYCSIDWLHELIKESIRRKKLARLRGISGVVSRLWDRSQAWVLVTLIGICTAVMASWIVSAEMYLYDLREGYCSKGLFRAKRFCCRSEADMQQPLSPHSLLPTLISIFDQSNLIPWMDPSSSQPNEPHQSNNFTTDSRPPLQSSSPFAARSFLSQHWSPSQQHFSIPSVILSSSNVSLSKAHRVHPLSCADWNPWSDLFPSIPSHWPSKLIFVLISLTLAGLASVLTVYFSRSTKVLTHPVNPDETPTLNPQENSRIQTQNSESDNRPDTPPPALTVTKVAYFASGSGIPEIKCILSGFVIVGYLGAGTLITKAVGLALSVASGLSLGKEGPFVHIGSCIGNLFARMFPKFNRNEGKRREILSSACAAGVAAAFGAPIGGVLFSLEEVSYFFPPKVMWRSCWCAMVTTATLRALDPFKTGKTVLFEVTYDRPWHFVELNAYILLGVLGGIFGALFAKANDRWSTHIRKSSFVSQHPILEVLAVTLATCLLALSSRFMRLAGTELVYELLAECDFSSRDHKLSTGPCISDPQETGKLLMNMGKTAVLKFLITVITFGMKIPAGIFVPSLSIGALMGRMLGLLFEYCHFVNPNLAVFSQCDPNRPFGQACIVPGVWAMVGAAAMLAGVTRTTVSLVVIVAELTGSLTYILPIAISVLVAKTIADAIERRSVYDLVIENLELPFLDAKIDYLHYARPADVMDSEADVIELDENIRLSDLRRLLNRLNQQQGNGFPIIEKLGRIRKVTGYIGVAELEHTLMMIGEDGGDPRCSFSGSDPDFEITEFEDHIDLGHLVDRAPVTVSINSPTELLHEMFARLGVRYLIIQDEYGSYSGIIEKNRWLRYLDWVASEGDSKKMQ